jgi:hypothetical protein
MEGSVMELIKNVTTISKGDQYLRAQHYKILTKVVDEVTGIHHFQLHNKLSNVQPTLKEVNFFPILCIIQKKFKFTQKNIKHIQMFISCSTILEKIMKNAKIM